MPVVSLVRHGQASFGADEYDVLSELGHEQARIVGAELARRGLRDPLLLCGKLARQRDTAAGVATATGWTVGDSDARWDEYDHLGLVQREAARAGDAAPDLADNRSLQDFLDVALATWIAENAPDGWGAFREAGLAALADVVALVGRSGQAAGRDAVVVTSGGVIAALCAALLDSVTSTTVVALNRVAVNTGITTLLLGRAGVSLSSYNDHGHLLGERRSLLTYR